MHELAVAEYRKTRRDFPKHPASAAWDCAMHSAKAVVLWEKLDGWTNDSGSSRYDNAVPADNDLGPVRISARPDDSYSPAHIGTREEEPETWEAYDRGGAWGTVGEYWDGECWQVADSVWGHVGYKNVLDPFENSYVADIMLATVAAYRAVKVCPKCHRPIRN